MSKHRRPLSPHLQIYKPQITTVLSIFHRIAGVGLALGSLILVAFLASLSMGAEVYAGFKEILSNSLIGLVLLGFVVALIFYFFGVIRHLMWDAGFGYELKTMRFTGWFLIAATAVTSALTLMVILC